MNDLEKCTTTTIDGDRLTISCKLGLWSVSVHVANMRHSIDEALHYFNQYKKDGEYDSLLSDGMPLLKDEKNIDVDMTMHNMRSQLESNPK